MSTAGRFEDARRAFDRIAADFKVSYVRDGAAHRVKAAGLKLEYPVGLKGNGFLEPDRWIARTHANGGIHEPGLLCALAVLADRLGAETVAITDIGALFGYAGLFAAAAFPEAEVHFVEPHPGSAATLGAALAVRPDRARLHLHPVLVGRTRGTGRCLIDRFRVEPYRPIRALPRVAPDVAADALRALAGRRRQRRVRVATIEEVPLTDLLAAPPKDARLIVKIDAEGHQAEFLPPAAETLIARRAVLLMECDGPEVLARYGTTSQDLCRPFLAAGYGLLWLDHRKPRQQAVLLDLETAAGKIERNSLAILLPPDLA